jgi:hypothetical protein
VTAVRPILLLPLVLAAVLLPASGRAADPVLKAKVGPGYSISIANPAGVKVTRVPAGTYSIDVSDLSSEHNFHLKGPGGIDMATDVAATGSVTWSVTFLDGIYTFQCDAHPGMMRGTLAVGAAPPPKPKLTGRVGPGKVISLKTPAGATVKSLKAGTYRLTVRDATKADNFHLLGRGVNKKTRVKFKGSVTWTVSFKAGSYTVRSDASRKLRRTFKVT